MPKVPTLQSQVSPNALPSVRVRQDYSPDEFGAGVGRGLQNVGAQLGAVAAQERRRAEETQTLELDTKLATLESTLLRDQNSGALNKRGRDAFGVDGQYLPEFDKQASELEKGIQSPRVKQVFQQLKARRRLGMNETLQRHIFEQGKAYETEQADAAIGSALDEAGNSYNDEARLQQAFARGQDGVRLKMRGASPEAQEAAMGEFAQKANAAVVTRMVADRDYARADAYLDAHKDQFDAGTYATLKGRVEGEIMDVKAETMGRDMYAKHGQNLGAAHKDIDKIEDKQLRDKVRQEYASLDARQEHMENRAKSEARQALQDYADAGNDPKGAPEWIKRTLGNTAITAASKRWQNTMRGDGEGKTDPLRFRALLRMSRDNPREFAKVDLYAEPLSNSSLKDMLGRQDDLTAGRGLKPFTMETTTKSISDIYERGTGIDLNKKDLSDAEKDRYNKFADLVEGEVNARQATSGKELDQQQVEEIARKYLVDTVVKTPRNFLGIQWNSENEVKTFEAAEQQIPPAQRRSIAAALQKRGEAVTPANIWKVWIVMQEQRTERGGN